MGRESRLPRREPPVDVQLTRLLEQFPDRAAYEAWLAKVNHPQLAAHLEQFLPPALRAQGTV